MYEYIKGQVEQLTPTYIIIDNQGIGYQVHCSLNTYAALKHGESAQLFIHQIIREDAHLLFGFISKEEREIFRLLLSVSGVGPNTARMMLSSMQPAEISGAILTGNVNALKKIKGIGLKTAERIIVDLRDKIGKQSSDINIFTPSNNTNREEALSALIMLGFPKNIAEKALEKVWPECANESVEVIIKNTLKQL